MSDSGSLTCDVIVKTEGDENISEQSSVVREEEQDETVVESTACDEEVLKCESAKEKPGGSANAASTSDRNSGMHEDYTTTSDGLELRYAQHKILPATLEQTRHCASSPPPEDEHEHLQVDGDCSDFDTPPSPSSPESTTSFSTMPSTSSPPDSEPASSSLASTDPLDDYETVRTTRKRPKRSCPVETLNVVQEMLLNPPLYHVHHLHSLAAFMAGRLRAMDSKKRKRVENRLIQLILDEDQ